MTIKQAILKKQFNRLKETLSRFKQTLKNRYTRYKTLRNQKRKEREENLKTLRFLKKKYNTRRSMNLEKTILQARNTNTDLLYLKGVMNMDKNLKLPTNPKNIEEYTRRLKTFEKNYETAKTLYGKRSKTRKIFNRFKKTLAKLVGKD